MYEPYYIRSKRFYNSLIYKLRNILSENPNLDRFRYDAVVHLTEKYPQRKEVGILVQGKDTYGMDFCKFYAINDIDFFHNQLNRRLDLGGR